MTASHWFNIHSFLTGNCLLRGKKEGKNICPFRANGSKEILTEDVHHGHFSPGKDYTSWSEKVNFNLGLTVSLNVRSPSKQSRCPVYK